MSLDVERGLVYLPVSTPSNDFYGARRPGANLFADSLVCLDANTGARKWHFQIVHHGLWDYDNASPPNLVTIHVDGRTIEAVVQLTKQGFAYVFDRVTGKPVWPIEERPVPASDVEGEHAWPTQPFPTKPPAFTEQGVTPDDVFDLTPELKNAALEELQKFRIGPLFTPPSEQGTVQRPGIIGGANWGGAAFDAASGVLFLKTTNQANIARVGPADRSPRTRAPMNPYMDLQLPARRSRLGFRAVEGLPGTHQVDRACRLRAGRGRRRRGDPDRPQRWQQRLDSTTAERRRLQGGRSAGSRRRSASRRRSRL